MPAKVVLYFDFYFYHLFGDLSRCCPAGQHRDRTYAPVKVKLLKNIRRAPLTKITWENSSAAQSPESLRTARHYRVDFETELGEADTMCVSVPDESEARRMAEDIVASGRVGLKGTQIISIKITEDRQL